MMCDSNDEQLVLEFSINGRIGEATYKNSPIMLPDRRADAWAFLDKFYGSLDFVGKRKSESRDLAFVISGGLTNFLPSIVKKFYFDHFKE